MADWTAFWSYVHKDNDHDGGRVLDLCHDLADRMHFRTGQEFTIFADRTGLARGDDWQATLDEAILQTTFLIPVVTPSYFVSQPCRDELLDFSATAESLGLVELILPIYYATTDQLENHVEAVDEVVDQIHRFQWQDLRQATLEDRTSSVYRKAVDQLATELIKRARQADSKEAVTIPPSGSDEPSDEGGPTNGADDTPPGGVPAGGSPRPSGGPGQTTSLVIEPSQEQDDEEEGILEQLVHIEEALPRLGEIMNGISPIVEGLGSDSEKAASTLKRSDDQGKGFAGRLSASREYAKALTARANELEPLVQSFTAELRVLDPAIRLTSPTRQGAKSSSGIR